MRKAITSSSLAFVARNVCGSLAESRGDVTTAGREAGKGEDLLRSIRDGMLKEPELPICHFLVGSAEGRHQAQPRRLRLVLTKGARGRAPSCVTSVLETKNEYVSTRSLLQGELRITRKKR